MKQKKVLIDSEKLKEELEEFDEYNELIDDDELVNDDSDDSDDGDDSEVVSKFKESDDEDEESSDDMDIMFKFNVNSHKIDGKHSLKRDTIFKGKLENPEDQIDEHIMDDNSNGIIIETGSSFEFESKYNEDYVNRLKLSQDVYEYLNEYTELDFSSNRRKPNRQAFNDYYKMLLDNIGKDYTKSEIFVELSYYFTDNIFNMFKLLDKEYATQIIVELKKSGYLSSLNNINFI